MTLKNWLDEYEVSHQNQTNKKIHYLCVPLIFFSIIALLWKIPGPVNISILLSALALIFYFRLSFKVGLSMLAAMSACHFIVLLVGRDQIFIPSLFIFVISWIGQFIGHKIEGKKPSFFKDLQFLLIGPVWVSERGFKK